MSDSSKEWVKTGVAGAAVIGTIVYCQYKYNTLAEEIKELRENQRVMANYVKLLESRLAHMVGNFRPAQVSAAVNQRRPQPQPYSESEEESEEFSDTEEEKAPVAKPQPPPPKPHIHRPQKPTPRVKEEKSVPKPAMPVPREDFERRERMRVPPSSAMRREKEQPPKSQPRVVVVTEEEEEEGLVANPVSMSRGVFDEDIDDPEDAKSDKHKRTTDRAAQMAAKAKARALAIKERRGGK